MPFSTLLGEDGLPPRANTKNEEEEEEEEDRAYDYACDELLKSGALSPINDSFLDASQELERGRSRDELADFIAEELQQGNNNNARTRKINADDCDDDDDDGDDAYSGGTVPSTSKRSNQSNSSNGIKKGNESRKRSSDNTNDKGGVGSRLSNDSQRSHSNDSNVGSTKGGSNNSTHNNQNQTKNKQSKIGGLGAHQRTSSFALLDSLSHEQPNPFMLGPILDDSAMRFLERNPSYSKFDDLEYAPVHPNLMAGEFDNLGRTQAQLQQQRHQMQLNQQQQYQHQMQQQQQQQQHFQRLAQQRQPTEFTSVNRSGMAGPPPQMISAHPPQFQQQQQQYQLQQQQEQEPTSQAQMTRLDRLKRWKEKRKNRVFTKSIRYMSRKVCADNRPRIKGKFVKVSSLSSLQDIAESNEDADEKINTNKDDDLKYEKKDSTKIDANELIRDLREKAIEAGLGAGKPLSRLRRNTGNASAPNLASLGEM